MLYKDQTDDGLRESYWSLRRTIANAADMRYAKGMSRNLRDLDIVVAIARKRGIKL